MTPKLWKPARNSGPPSPSTLMNSAGDLAPWVGLEGEAAVAQHLDRRVGRELAGDQPVRLRKPQAGVGDNRLAVAPAVVGEVIRDARDDVRPAAPEVALAVAVAVDRPGAVAARHELAVAHRAGVGAEHRLGVEAFLAREQQELLELGAEVARARRVVEGERRERVHHAELAGDAAKEGFAADDADDDVRRDAARFRDAVDVLAIEVPERDAGVDALGGEEVLAVGVPRHHGLGRFRDELDDARLDCRVGQHGVEPLGVEAMLLLHLLGEGADVLARKVERARRQRRRGE